MKSTGEDAVKSVGNDNKLDLEYYINLLHKAVSRLEG